MALKIHKQIASLVPYSPGKPLSELERELGSQDAIKLASNENPLGPSPRALAVLLQNAPTLNRYPDGGAHDLRQGLAERLKVDPAQIILGNGSDEIISMLVRAFLSPDEEAIMAEQTFVMYKLAVTAGHGIPVEIPLKNWRHDLSAMAGAVTERTRLLFLCNPNNPTGTIVDSDEIEAFILRIPDHVILVVDEAYYEYVRDPHFPDCLSYIQQNRHVIVLRTFSKIYGLAGLRIGYGVTTPEIADYLNRVRQPFNTNTMAQQAALAALSDEDHVARSRSILHAELPAIARHLEALGLSPVPSQANFLYFDTRRDGKQVFDVLLHQGIIIRHIQGPMVRVTIGRPEENRRFLEALESVIKQLPASS